MSPLLQAYDRALLGGRPDEVPELMAERNPINSADAVEAPVLFLIGEHDSRCPLRQAMAYVDRLAARGHPHELYLFSTGHGSYDIDEEIRQQRVILDFLAGARSGGGGPSGLSRYRGSMPMWIVVLTALLGAFVIWRVGIAMLRSLTMTSPPGSASDEPAPAEPEDVDDLGVYLVCGECGTELKVSRLGELQIPRHCGEKMQVVRRPEPA